MAHNSLTIEEIARETLAEAIRTKVGSRNPGYQNDKCLIDGKLGINGKLLHVGLNNQLLSLISKGAKIVYINKPRIDKPQIIDHELEYKGHIFIAYNNKDDPFPENPLRLILEYRSSERIG